MNDALTSVGKRGCEFFLATCSTTCPFVAKGIRITDLCWQLNESALTFNIKSNNTLQLYYIIKNNII